MLGEHLMGEEVGRILDLGTGDGHLIALLRRHWPAATALGLDLSPYSSRPPYRCAAHHIVVRPVDAESDAAARRHMAHPT
jgi:trans-aconitate methyltransferase